MRTLSREQARRVYDRIGSWQDSQAFYEDRAVAEVTRLANFGESGRALEFGCGTGRYAERLLSEFLPETGSYRGVDISPVMVELAKERLLPFAPRAVVELSEGEPPRAKDGELYDRFVSNYVLDLLSEADIRGVIDAAYAALEPGGLLCLTSLSEASSSPSRFILACWSLLRSIDPAVVGGCRPLSLLDYVGGPRWHVQAEERVVQFGVPSQVVVASRA